MRQFSSPNRLKFGAKLRRLCRSTLRSLKFGDALIVAGVILVCFPMLWSMRSNLLQAKEEAAWVQATTAETAADIAPFRPAHAKWGRTRIICEKIGLDAVVVQGRHLRDLSRGPMHIPTTAGPGEGNCAIAAHKEKWFRQLGTLETGDEVELLTNNARYVYEVMGRKTVTPYDVSVLDHTLSPTLTLITCTGAPYRRSPNRLIVTARLVRTDEKSTLSRGWP